MSLRDACIVPAPATKVRLHVVKEAGHAHSVQARESQLAGCKNKETGGATILIET